MYYKEEKYLPVRGKLTLDQRPTLLIILQKHKKSLPRATGLHKLFSPGPTAFQHGSLSIYNSVMGMDEALAGWNESLYQCSLPSLLWEISPTISGQFLSASAFHPQALMELSFQGILALAPFPVPVAISQQMNPLMT